jgi:hypothetical protein
VASALGRDRAAAPTQTPARRVTCPFWLESVPWLPLAKVAQKRLRLMLRLHMSREEALAVAAAEGLVLVPAANASGFRGVTPNRARRQTVELKGVRSTKEERLHVVTKCRNGGQAYDKELHAWNDAVVQDAIEH